MTIPKSQSGAASTGNTRRKSKAREAMIIAADELFSELGGYEGGGYEATTVDLIVARAGVSRRSFFNHFTGKADVLMLDFRAICHNHMAEFRARPDSEEPLLAALLAMEYMNESFFSNPDNKRRSSVNRRRFARQLRLGMKSTQWSLVGEWELLLAEEIARRLKGRDKRVRARILAGHASLIIRIASEQWFTQGLLKGDSIGKSLRKAEALANKVVDEAYPIMNG
jgi:AcrR family transcriptional regulator